VTQLPPSYHFFPDAVQDRGPPVSVRRAARCSGPAGARLPAPPSPAMLGLASRGPPAFILPAGAPGRHCLFGDSDSQNISDHVKRLRELLNGTDEATRRLFGTTRNRS